MSERQASRSSASLSSSSSSSTSSWFGLLALLTLLLAAVQQATAIPPHMRATEETTLPHESMAVEVNKLLGRLFPAADESSFTTSSWRPARLHSRSATLATRERHHSPVATELDATSAYMPSLYAPFTPRTRKQGNGIGHSRSSSSAPNGNNNNNLFMLWSPHEANPAAALARHSWNALATEPDAEYRRMTDSFAGVNEPATPTPSSFIGSDTTYKVDMTSDSDSNGPSRTRGEPDLTVERPEVGSIQVARPAHHHAAAGEAGRGRGWKVVGMGKRGPKCMRDCITEGRLHPLQCHSLC